MDILKMLGVLLFILLCALVMHLDRTSEIEVVTCEKDGLTHYIGRHAPNRKLKFGVCKAERMSKGEYYALKFEFKKSTH